MMLALGALVAIAGVAGLGWALVRSVARACTITPIESECDALLERRQVETPSQSALLEVHDDRRRFA